MIRIAFPAVLVLACTAIAALVVIDAPTVPAALLDDEVCDDDVDAMAPVGPVRIGRQFRVNCASMDGGAATDMLVPMDGGTAGKRVATDQFYAAPISTSSTDIRIGLGGSVTATTGWEIGEGGRDGVGLSLEIDESAQPRCMSTGAAVQADVITGVE